LRIPGHGRLSSSASPNHAPFYPARAPSLVAETAVIVRDAELKAARRTYLI
jgi:hypothetical protein